MTDRIGQQPGLSSLNRFERLTLLGSVLIWVGVIAFGIGLVMALNNHRVEQVAYANAAAEGSIATEKVASSPTPTAAALSSRLVNGHADAPSNINPDAQSHDHSCHPGQSGALAHILVARGQTGRHRRRPPAPRCLPSTLPIAWSSPRSTWTRPLCPSVGQRWNRMARPRRCGLWPTRL